MAALEQAIDNKKRADINGLRAWAVIAVVLYHYGVPGFEGGFAGVDVFFVISGFLMTRIILEALESQNGFSFSQFFMARARRTVPALAFLCGTLLVLGSLIFPATEYFHLAQHCLAALGFISNITFWREVDYFDVSSQEKWLLHTWSLSVEWQFYLLLPVALAMLWRWRHSRRIVALGMGLGLAGSLLLSITFSNYPGIAFYLLPTRAWEMLAGGLALLCGSAIVLTPSQRRWLELTGLALLCFTFGYLDSDLPWPGAQAMIPVAGAVLVLLAARSDSAWTGNVPAQIVGTGSYSLYLWHWPLAVALGHLRLKDSPFAVLAALTTAMILSYLSWRLIEQPARRLQRRPATARVVLALAIAAVALPAGYVLHAGGVAGRLPGYIDLVFAESTNKDARYKECQSVPGNVKECTYGGPKPGVIVIGDSHAHAVMRSVEKALPSADSHVIAWSVSGCPTLSGVKSTTGRSPAFCGDYVAGKIVAQQRIAPAVPMIILNRLSAYAFTVKGSKGIELATPRIYFSTVYQSQSPNFNAQFREHIIGTACAFARTRPVFLVRPIPEMARNVPRTMGVALLRGRPERVSVSLTAYRERNSFVWEAQDAARQQCGVAILNPLPYLCDAERCFGDRDGLPLYIDDNHLSERGAHLLQPMFARALR